MSPSLVDEEGGEVAAVLVEEAEGEKGDGAGRQRRLPRLAPHLLRSQEPTAHLSRPALSRDRGRGRAESGRVGRRRRRRAGARRWGRRRGGGPSAPASRSPRSRRAAGDGASARPPRRTLPRPPVRHPFRTPIHTAGHGQSHFVDANESRLVAVRCVDALPALPGFIPPFKVPLTFDNILMLDAQPA